MATSLDVAAYILRAMGTEDDSWMRAKSLQKLVYYSQAWAMVWQGRPLFGDTIEAWRDGPVVRRLYAEHRRQYGVSAISEGNADALDSDEKAILDSVLAFYGSMACEELVEQTQRELPWQRARGNLPYGAHSSADISQASMRSYYTAKSLLGEPTPTRPMSYVAEADSEEVQAENKVQMDVWRETLDWLAVR